MRLIKICKLITSIILGLLLSILTSCRNEKDTLVENIPENLPEIQINDEAKSFLLDLKNYNFEICNNVDCLTETNKEILYDRAKGSLHYLRTFRRENFDAILTFDKEKWASGCSARDNEALILIEFVIETNNKLGLGYKIGGLATSSIFAIYDKNNNEELKQWSISRSSETLPDLILELLKTD